MTVIRAAASRRSETPFGVMTTLASPTQGGAGHALWRVDVPAGASGPRHLIDAEQIWTFLDGGATVDLDGEEVSVALGDTLVMPAGVPRQVRSENGFAAIVSAPAGAMASMPGSTEKMLPPWIA